MFKQERETQTVDTKLEAHYCLKSEVAQRPPRSILYICLQSIYNFVLMIVRTVISLCRFILYTRQLLPVCLSRERDPASVALPEVSYIFSLLFLWGCWALYPIQGYQDPRGKFVICDTGAIEIKLT